MVRDLNMLTKSTFNASTVGNCGWHPPSCQAPAIPLPTSIPGNGWGRGDVSSRAPRRVACMPDNVSKLRRVLRRKGAPAEQRHCHNAHSYKIHTDVFGCVSCVFREKFSGCLGRSFLDVWGIFSGCFGMISGCLGDFFWICWVCFLNVLECFLGVLVVFSKCIGDVFCMF